MILGIETATQVCAAAIVKDGIVVAENYLTEPNVHSEKLITLINNTLMQANSGGEATDNLKKLNAISISNGPGSFTGLRVGFSVAKAIAYACNKPLVTVPTLEALGFNFVSTKNYQTFRYLCPLIDARRDEFYSVILEYENNKFVRVVEQSAYKFDDLVKLIPGTGKIIFIGDGIEKFQKFISIKNISNELWNFNDGISNLCSAGSVALLGEIKFNLGQIEDLTNLEPDYVKDFYTLFKTS